MAQAKVKSTTPRSRKPKEVPFQAVPVVTREGLIEQMGTLLDEVDQVVKGERSWVSWSFPSSGGLNNLRIKRQALDNGMTELLGAQSEERSDRVFIDALRIKPGQTPTPARPCRLLGWIGYVPVMLEWEGFVTGHAACIAADPAEKWFNGHGESNIYTGSIKLPKDMAAWFRTVLLDYASRRDQRLVHLDSDVRDRLTAALAGDEWLRGMLDKGPTDPVPLPSHLQAVQQTFAL